MTKEEFERLQLQQKESGLRLKEFLNLQSIKYTTFNYWRTKYSKDSSGELPLAPIQIQTKPIQRVRSNQGEVSGITLALPNGIQAHFSSGECDLAIQFLTQSLQNHVLSE